MKPYILSAVFAVFCIILVLFYSPCMEAAAFGYILWLDCIFPAVFPFMVCTHIIGESGILERLLKKNRRNLRIPMISLPIFLLCVISGIPSGARCGKLLYERSLMTKRGATIISASCNMASPMFIAGSLCSSILGFEELILPICAAHYLTSAIIMAAGFLIFPEPRHKSGTSAVIETPSFFSLASSALKESMLSSLSICASIVFFSVIIGLLRQFLNSDSLPFGILSSVLEMTNGCKVLSGTALPPSVLCAAVSAVISFGGICVLFQSLSFFRPDVKLYMALKAISAPVAAVTAFLICKALDIDTTSVFIAQQDFSAITQRLFPSGAVFAASALAMGITTMITAAASRRT